MGWCISSKEIVRIVELTGTRTWLRTDRKIADGRIQVYNHNAMIVFISNVHNIVIGDRYTSGQIELKKRWSLVTFAHPAIVIPFWSQNACGDRLISSLKKQIRAWIQFSSEQHHINKIPFLIEKLLAQMTADD